MNLKIISKVVLGLLYILAGLNHFLNPAMYVEIMPPFLPWPLGLVYTSGIFEILLGALVLIPRFTKLAAWSIILMLIAFIPVHLYMAFNASAFADIPAVLLWLRLPMQAVLIAWAYWHTR